MATMCVNIDAMARWAVTLRFPSTLTRHTRAGVICCKVTLEHSNELDLNREYFRHDAVHILLYALLTMCGQASLLYVRTSNLALIRYVQICLDVFCENNKTNNFIKMLKVT